MANDEKHDPLWPVVWRLFGWAGKQRGWFWLAVVLDLLQAAVLILTSHFNRKFFDAVSANMPQQFWLYAGLMLSLSITNLPLSYGRARGMGQFSEAVLAHLREAIAARGARLPVGYLEARHSGDMLSVLNADLAKLKTLLANNLLDVVSQTVRGVAAFAYILSINWILALVSVITTPLMFLLISRLTAPVAQKSEAVQDAIGNVNAIAQDGLAGSMIVKAFNLAPLMEQRFDQANHQAVQKGLSIARLKGIIDGLTMPLAIVSFILAIGLGGYFMIHKQMTFGGLFVFINLLNYVVNPLGSLPGVFASIGEGAGAARRVFALFDQPLERADGAAEIAAHAGGAALTFADVTFGYGPAEAVLRGVSLEIPAGQTVAIVGPSGGGKSTLIKLLLGFYPLTQGRICLWGRDLNDWQLTASRQQMAFVAQDTYLFPVSLAENIRLGKPAASQADVEQAARLANIHDFIVSLPEGYAASAGEWGGRLSGGQKQRIALARAILKDAPILLLDEPTSALDTESESLVQQALERFSSGRTTLVIAHRLSTIKNAHRVVVVADGKIVESGTHEELLARGGLYLELYQRQFVLDAPMRGEKLQERIA